jgi:hypothetical protein
MQSPTTRAKSRCGSRGYNNTSQSGIKYLGLSIEPDYKTQKLIEEKLAASGAAQSLATATDGVVVAVNDDDLF